MSLREEKNPDIYSRTFASGAQCLPSSEASDPALTRGCLAEEPSRGPLHVLVPQPVDEGVKHWSDLSEQPTSASQHLETAGMYMDILHPLFVLQMPLTQSKGSLFSL